MNLKAPAGAANENGDVEMNTQTTEEHRGKRRKRLAALLTTAVILLIAIACLTATCTASNEEGSGAQPTAVALMPDIDANAEGITVRSDMEQAMQAQADADYFTLQVNPQASFSASTGTGTFEIVNPPTNVYPISVELHLDDGRLVYSSGGILPNMQVRQVESAADLTPGTYSATARVTIYDETDHKKAGETEAKISIEVRE